MSTEPTYDQAVISSALQIQCYKQRDDGYLHMALATARVAQRYADGTTLFDWWTGARAYVNQLIDDQIRRHAATLEANHEVTAS